MLTTVGQVLVNDAHTKTIKEKKMSKESYIRGFCKAAEAAGVDPVALAKYAQVGINGLGSSPAVGSFGMGLWANGTNPVARGMGPAASSVDSRIKHYQSLIDKHSNPPMLNRGLLNRRQPMSNRGIQNRLNRKANSNRVPTSYTTDVDRRLGLNPHEVESYLRR